MGYSFLRSHSLLSFSHIVCIVGLILSQTHLLINIKVDYSHFHVPTFTLIYFSLSTIGLLVLIVNYAFFKGAAGAWAIDFYQHIGIGLSVVLLRLLLGYNPLDSFAKIACLILLMLQCVLISTKIIYLGSVTKELSQISGLTKLTRILKLSLTAIIPQFVSSNLPLVIILSVCQVLTILMFLFKYTYQNCSVQYVLLIGVLGGFISSLEDMLSNLFEYDYYYLGECFIIVVFLIPQTPFLSLLEIKYRLLFTGLSQNKSEDQHLAELIFLYECLFEAHQTLKFSQSTKNEAIIQVSNMIERTKKQTYKDNENNEMELQQGSYLFFNQIQQGGIRLQQSFFQIVLSRFKQTSNFQTFNFLINCTLGLPKKYTNFSLILYYGFRERTIHKRSSLEQCRYEYTYRVIARRFSSQYQNKQQISFLQFSDELQKLNGLIENCLTDEILIIQALTNDQKKNEIFADTGLLKLHATKEKIKETMEVCFKSKLYLFSNEFKYVYLLYNTAVEKKYIELKKDIKRRFLSVQAKSIEADYFPRYLTVLNGFTNGEIVNCNQSFKNYFKFVTTNSQNKSTISQLFPNDKQKRRHNSLMLQYNQQACDREGDHSKYECLLGLQAEMGGFKFKALQRFRIITRIYCENQFGFNYVCQFVRLDQRNQDVITILKRERDFLEKKGLQLIPKHTHIINQLDEEFEICDIEGDFRNQSFATISKISNCGQYQVQAFAEVAPPETCLDQKIKLIEQKIIEEKRLKKFNIINFWMIVELIAILMLSTMIGVTYLKLQSEVNSLSFVLTVEMKAIRQANLIRNRIMVEKLILNIVKGTNYFPDSICQFQQINNLTSYFINYMSDDMTDNFDDFINMLISPNLEDYPLPKLYNNYYSSIPYLFNYRNNITFQKYISLLKSKEIYWIAQLQNGSKATMDQRYYSSIFPNQLLSYTIFTNYSMYSLDAAATDSYYNNLMSTINQLKVIFAIINVALMFILTAFRVKDTLPLINILAAFETIDNKILFPRLRELKYSLSLLRKIKTTRIKSLEIDSKAYITIENDKQEPQTKMVQNFTKEQRQFYKINEDQGYNQRQEQNTALLKYREIQSSHNLPKSAILRTLIYNKWFLLLVLVLMGTIVASCALFLNGFATKIQALQSYENIDQKMTLLNQKFINVIAFNWLKAYSLTSPSFNMTAVNVLYNDSLSAFKAMNLQKLFYQNYPSSLANEILYGNICKYFLSPQFCAQYRSGAFLQGLSVILPFTIKQQIQGSEISQNDYTYYFPLACDKTYVFFEGIVPLNKKIPAYGLQTVLGDIDKYLLMEASLTITIVGFLFLITIIWQFIRRDKLQKVRQEVLSLDTVNNLYYISDLKPYFNKIYYA